jgi:hypothetical protein
VGVGAGQRRGVRRRVEHDGPHDDDADDRDGAHHDGDGGQH